MGLLEPMARKTAFRSSMRGAHLSQPGWAGSSRAAPLNEWVYRAVRACRMRFRLCCSTEIYLPVFFTSFELRLKSRHSHSQPSLFLCRHSKQVSLA